MKISGNYTIDAPREQVWDALNDIDVLARVVPGCQRLEQTGENEFEGTVKIGIQTIRGTYSGRIRLEDVQPPQHYKLVANGKSANGIVDGTGTVDLEEQDGKTLLKYAGDANVAGTLASVGQRLIEGAAKQMINQSLKALVEQINKRQAGETDELPSDDGQQTAGDERRTTNDERRTTNEETSRPAASTTTPAASMIGQAATAAATATSGAARPASSAATPGQSTSTPSQTEETPRREASTTSQASQSFQRRAVEVPADEQLKPEAVALGMAQDFYNERPWLPWVIVAFLLGFIVGRARS